MLTAEINTPRLKLRSFRFSDTEAVHAYLQEPDMGRYLEGDGSRLSETDTRVIIASHILADRSERNVWVITLEDRAIGGISINFAKQHRVAELGYSIAKTHWGHGLAAEAAQAVIDQAFSTCKDLQRIQANIHPGNIGSIRVAQKVNMVHEGTLRCYAFVGDEIADEDIYAVLRSDWHKGRLPQA